MGWSHAESVRREALELYETGASYQDITIATGASRRSVQNWARAAGLPPRQSRRRHQGYSHAVRNKARKLRSKGWSMGDVAYILGVSKSAVVKWVNAAVLLLLLGCDQSVPVFVMSLQYDHGPADTTSEDAELLDDAFGLWGLDWHPSSTRRCAVHVALVDHEQSPLTLGQARWDANYPFVLSERESVTLAHELGHLWGHPHHPNPDNVMHAASTANEATEITVQQLDDAQPRITRLLRCR